MVKVLPPAARAIAFAIVNLPTVAWTPCLVVIALLLLYGTNATRLLKRKDANRGGPGWRTRASIDAVSTSGSRPTT